VAAFCLLVFDNEHSTESPVSLRRRRDPFVFGVDGLRFRPRFRPRDNPSGDYAVPVSRYLRVIWIRKKTNQAATGLGRDAEVN
jgi:hypothetical protein